MSAEEIFFVKLEEGKEVFEAADVIPSSYSKKKQVYLFNADPGRYVAVAAGLGSTETRQHLSGSSGPYLATSIGKSAFFSMAMISATEVTVAPQEMVFMGEYLVTTSSKMKTADLAQAHYYRLLLPGVAGRPALVRMFDEQNVYTADLESVARDPATERGFWTTARDKVFKGDPRWQARAERQLAALSEQDPN